MSKGFRGLAGLVDDLEFGRGFVKENDKHVQLKLPPPIPNLAQRYAGRVVSPEPTPKVRNLALSYNDVGDYRYATAIETEPAPYMRNYQPIPDQYKGYTPSRNPSRSSPAEERRRRAVTDASMLARVQNLGPTPPLAPAASATVPQATSSASAVPSTTGAAAPPQKPTAPIFKRGATQLPSAGSGLSSPMDMNPNLTYYGPFQHQGPIQSGFYGPDQAHFPAMGFGSANAVVGGALVGGGTAWIGSTEENRGAWTFAKGATFGAAGGAVVSGVASRGMISGVAEWGQAVSKNFDFGTEFAGKAVQTARGIESAEARAALFATGAMLGGGMFGTNRNRAQGLNSTRGNRFGG